MLIKIMSNRVVIKIMSIPIVMKIITVEMKAFMWVMSLFSRKKKATPTEQGQPPESGSSPPTHQRTSVQSTALDILSKVRQPNWQPSSTGIAQLIISYLSKHSDFYVFVVWKKLTFVVIIGLRQEGSHSGLVRPPAKRLGGETSLMGSNPIPSASLNSFCTGQSSSEDLSLSLLT